MGYTSCRSWRNVRDIAREVTEPNANTDAGVEYETIAAAITKSGIWAVREFRGPEHTERYIMLYLVESMGGALAYKDMDEEMGPYYYDCPPELFAICPTTSPRALAWRDKVVSQ